MPGYLLTTQGEAHAIREEVGMPNVKVQMDLYHAQIVEGDLSVKLTRWLNDIGHIQIAGVPERHEPDSGSSIATRCSSCWTDRLPGMVGCEYRPRDGTVPGLSLAGQAWVAYTKRKVRPKARLAAHRVEFLAS